MSDAATAIVPEFEINPLSNLMAAEIIGLDLRHPLGATTSDAIYQAFLDYQVLAFRDQDLTKEEQVAFTEQFGTLEKHAQRNRGTAGHPLVLSLIHI